MCHFEELYTLAKAKKSSCEAPPPSTLLLLQNPNFLLLFFSMPYHTFIRPTHIRYDRHLEGHQSRVLTGGLRRSGDVPQ